jgi:CRISPR/Cas system-associated exonuclease Cas4 (RecB family)
MNSDQKLQVSEIVKFLKENSKYVRLLRLALDHERQNENNPEYKGWAWNDVRAYPPAILAKIVAEGIIKISYKSRRYTNYLLVDRETVRNALKELEKEEIEKIFKK